MKKIALIFLLIISNLITKAQIKQKVPIDSLGKHLLSINYRVFELALGLEIKYLHLKNREGLSPTLGVGYSAIINNSSVKNAYYDANGVFGKIGFAYNTKFPNLSIYFGVNSIYSFSNQTLKPTFTNQIWGTYQEEFTTSDFNIGMEGALGMMVKISNNFFFQTEGSLGTKLLHQVNPIKDKIQTNDPSYLPYYNPGMGRGGILFINASVGIGYQF